MPSAAPAGTGNGKLGFVSDGHVFSADPAGGGELDLGFGNAPAWSPDGTRIAFLEGGVSVMNADGSERRHLHTGDDRQPVWSPDGTRLAFVNAQPQPNAGDLVVVDVASGEARSLASSTVQGAWAPSWSPDGTRLAYTEGTAIDLAVVGADGSGRRIVAGGAGVDLGPAWSPDGTQIAFIHSAAGDAPALHVVDAAGGPVRRLTQTIAGFRYLPVAPAWSPDGSRIAFTGSTLLGYDRFGPIYRTDVHVVDAEGTLERRLTDGGGISRPVWSPDGRRIAFDAGGLVYVMNPDGTCETRVGSRSAHSPTWQPVAGGSPAPLLRCADLDLRVVNDLGSVAADGEDTFRITVKNLDNEPATGVRLEASRLERGSFVSASPGSGVCSLTDGSLSCELGSLAVGEVVGIAVVARAEGVGVVSSHARVTANEPDGEQANNARDLRFEALPCDFVGARDGGRVVGTPGVDTICGLSGPDVIVGLGGADAIDAGLGRDRVFPGSGRDDVRLRAGADFIDARDDQRDTIDCGGERDLVLADPIDRVSRDCELVARPRIARCKTLGTGRSDKLVGTPRTDSVCALSGNDEIHVLGGNDAVDAGSGNDTIVGGPGRDVLLGAEGYDTIFARDGARDRVRCGPQYDVVFADERDLVAQDCEHVARR